MSIADGWLKQIYASMTAFMQLAIGAKAGEPMP